MGHERVGALPHSKPWRDIVAQIAASSNSPSDVEDLARTTLDNVRSRFRRIQADEGVIAAFQFLIALSKAGSPDSQLAGPNAPVIDLRSNPSALRLVAGLRSWVDSHQESAEYADIAKKAGADAIVLWSEQQQQQATLFPHEGNSADIWRRADTGAGFCEVARLFFAKFTERYLNYFLGREASAVLTGAGTRDELSSQLRDHIDGVSRYAFETSRITQSFAAGWFNQHARDRVPPADELESFLSVAFGKMRDELMREASSR